MKLPRLFIFISILTAACTQQQVKQPLLAQQQPVKKEINHLQNVSPQPDLTNKTTLVMPRQTTLEIKAAHSHAIDDLPAPKIKAPTAAQMKKSNSNKTRRSTKAVTKPDKALIAEKTQAEAAIEKKLSTRSPQPSQQKAQNSISISEDKLPIRFGSTWTLDKRHDSESNKTRCLLTSITRKFNDGYDESNMFLQFSSTALFIKTDSKIDLSYPETGIYIDQNSPFQFEQIFNENNVFNKKDMAAITALLVKGKQITIKLGFWPTWPKTATSTVVFTLKDFDQAYPALKACERI